MNFYLYIFAVYSIALWFVVYLVKHLKIKSKLTFECIHLSIRLECTRFIFEFQLISNFTHNRNQTHHLL